MPVFVMIGAAFMTAALGLYTVAIWRTAITGKVKRSQVVIQTCAVIADALGTFCMIVNSGWRFIPADFHGWIGYVALTGMVVDLVFVYKHRANGVAATPMRVYSLLIWILWVVSYSLGFVKMG